MARIRTIKPEFWTDAKTGTLTDTSKCLFLGLLNHADDYGVVAWSPIEWRAKILPYHSDTTHGVVTACLVNELLPRGLMVLFSFTDDDGELKRFGFIKNFGKHQIINRPSKPILPGWKIGDTPESYAKRLKIEYQEIGDITLAPLHEPSVSPPGALTPGKERKGKEDSEPPLSLVLPHNQDSKSEPSLESQSGVSKKNAAVRGTRWPKDAVVSEDWIVEGIEIGGKLGLTEERIRHEAGAFVDWALGAGTNGVKLDWRATWRNWVRRQRNTGRGGQPRARFSRTDQLQRLIADADPSGGEKSKYADELD